MYRSNHNNFSNFFKYKGACIDKNASTIGVKIMMSTAVLKSVERTWKQRGKSIERAWKECGKTVERTWKERGKSVERA